MYCTQCGTLNDDNSQVCTGCGSAVPLRVDSIPNYLTQAILVTVCCCVPFGIPAIVYAAQVNTKVTAGDVNGALDCSKKAKMWCWIAFGCGLAGGLMYLGISLVGVLADM